MTSGNKTIVNVYHFLLLEQNSLTTKEIMWLPSQDPCGRLYVSVMETGKRLWAETLVPVLVSPSACICLFVCVANKGSQSRFCSHCIWSWIVQMNGQVSTKLGGTNHLGARTLWTGAYQQTSLLFICDRSQQVNTHTRRSGVSWLLLLPASSCPPPGCPSYWSWCSCASSCTCPPWGTRWASRVDPCTCGFYCPPAATRAPEVGQREETERIRPAEVIYTANVFVLVATRCVMLRGSHSPPPQQI